MHTSSHLHRFFLNLVVKSIYLFHNFEMCCSRRCHLHCAIVIFHKLSISGELFLCEWRPITLQARLQLHFTTGKAWQVITLLYIIIRDWTIGETCNTPFTVWTSSCNQVQRLWVSSSSTIISTLVCDIIIITEQNLHTTLDNFAQRYITLTLPIQTVQWQSCTCTGKSWADSDVHTEHNYYSTYLKSHLRHW